MIVCSGKWEKAMVSLGRTGEVPHFDGKTIEKESAKSKEIFRGSKNTPYPEILR
jgi:hypothetical protein